MATCSHQRHVGVEGTSSKCARGFSKRMLHGQKSNKRYSFIALDQIHEQENVKVKSAGGALDILDKGNALRRCMLAGPEQANLWKILKAYSSKVKLTYGISTTTKESKALQRTSPEFGTSMARHRQSI